MALLLAKKLGNQIARLAKNAGITLGGEIVNYYNDGSKKAAGCKGTIRNTKTGKRVIVLSSESCPDTVRLEIINKPTDTYPEKTFSVRNKEAAGKIVELLTQPAQAHTLLASAGVTNLPALDKNPILSTYLCDASTNTDIWLRGRDKLTDQLRKVELYTVASHTTYTYSTEDNYTTADRVRNALWLGVGGDCDHDHMVYHQLLAYHDVIPSESVQGRIAYYQDDAKRAKDIRTPIKVRKYLSKFFGECLDADKLEEVAVAVDDALTTPDKWDVRHYSDADIDGWCDAYYHVVSCMNISDNSYGVGKHETYRCYCTHAMTDGAKSSGLTLAVLYQGGKPVARAITYEDNSGDKYYVRNYGDDRLVRWLDYNGYYHQAWLPNDTHLWTEHHSSDEYLSPYVDGSDDDAKAKLTIIGGQPYWVISSDGVVLQNCCGYTCAYQLTCDCCGDEISSGDEYARAGFDGDDVTLCYRCEEDHCHTVDGETGIYVPDYELNDLIETNTQGYYTQEYLDNHCLVFTGDGYVMHENDTDLCRYSDEYYSITDFVDLSDEPEFVRDTWAGYINDNDRVLNHLYNRDGTYIEELDTRVHDAHISAIRHRLETQAS